MGLLLRQSLSHTIHPWIQKAQADKTTRCILFSTFFSLFFNFFMSTGEKHPSDCENSTQLLAIICDRGTKSE